MEENISVLFRYYNSIFRVNSKNATENFIEISGNFNSRSSILNSRHNNTTFSARDFLGTL